MLQRRWARRPSTPRGRIGLAVGMAAGLAVIVPSTPTKVFNALANINHAAEAEAAHLDLPRLLRQRAVLPLVVLLLTLVADVDHVHFGVQQQEQRVLRRRPRAQQFLQAERRLDLLDVEERAARAVGLSVHERVRLRGLHLLLEELRLHLRLEYAPSVELEAHTALHALRLLSRRIRFST